MSRGQVHRFAALDGLRAVAVLLVFLHHVDEDVFVGGWIGVDLFFALSGYLITTLLLGEWAKSGSIGLGAFYMRRLLRLMPALLVLVVVLLPLAIWRGIGQPFVDAGVTVLYLMDVYAPLAERIGGLFSHTWSLAVEEQFYLFWPALLVLALRRGWSVERIATAALVGTAIAGALTVSAVEAYYAYRSPFVHMPVMLSGVLLALAVSRRDAWLGRLRGAWLPAVAAVLLVAVTFAVHLDWLPLYFGGFVALGVALTGLVGHLVMAPTGPAARALSGRPLVWLGQRSYGFYLWHFPVLVALSQVTGSPLVLAIVGLLASLACTVVSWRVVEQPFLRMKRRFELGERVPVAQ